MFVNFFQFIYIYLKRYRICYCIIPIWGLNMRTIFGISTIFLIVGLLVAPGCAFAVEFGSGNSFSDIKLSASSEKINTEVKGGGGGGRGGGSSSSFKSSGSKAAKKVDTDGDGDVDDDDDAGFPWWLIIIIIVIILLGVAAVIWFALRR